MNPVRQSMLLPLQSRAGILPASLIHNLATHPRHLPTAPTTRKSYACPAQAWRSGIVNRKCETPETFHLCFTLFRETFHLPTPCSSSPSQTVSGCTALYRHRFLHRLPILARPVRRPLRLSHWARPRSPSILPVLQQRGPRARHPRTNGRFPCCSLSWGRGTG
jgi:hypothetical protein